MKVYNGDVVVGSTFNSSSSQCTVSPKNIYAWNNNTSPYSGSGSNFGVMATGNIFGFASNQGLNGNPPLNLTFANDSFGTAQSSSWGGNMASVPCIHDYWDSQPANIYNPAATSNAIQVNAGHCPYSNTSACTALYTTNAFGVPQIISPGLSISPGQHATIYVNGSVDINGNITYTGTWNGLSGTTGMPSFTLIASGNIYISPNVTELDGTFVAQGGTIYTCDNAGAVPSPLHHYCSNQLKIYGSLVASHIDFMRTLGTLSQAANPSSNLCGSADPNAAEVICYTPATWLGQPGINNNYNEITSPPPIL